MGAFFRWPRGYPLDLWLGLDSARDQVNVPFLRCPARAISLPEANKESRDLQECPLAREASSSRRRGRLQGNWFPFE